MPDLAGAVRQPADGFEQRIETFALELPAAA
jgi:hypothetical protein